MARTSTDCAKYLLIGIFGGMRVIFAVFYASIALMSCSGNSSESMAEENADSVRLEVQKEPDRANCECLSEDSSHTGTAQFSKSNNAGKHFYLSYKTNKEGKRVRTYVEIATDFINRWSKYSTSQVRVLSLAHYDTIPQIFSHFQNVSRIEVSEVFGVIEGLDMFPCLRALMIDNSTISFDTTEKWLGQVEMILVGKASINGLTSFKHFTNLSHLSLGFSGLRPFPDDLGSLTCLNSFRCGAYMWDDVDLRKIDLSRSRCLRTFYFETWRDNAKGIPRGADKLPLLREFQVKHSRLTKKEKEVMRRIRQRRTKDSNSDSSKTPT